MSKPRIFHAFVDGACKGNNLHQSVRRAAYGIWFSDNHWHRAQPISPPRTNNRAELMGLVTLLESVLAGETNVTEHDDLRVYVDNQYMRNAALTWIPGWRRNKWRTKSGAPVKNLELMMRLGICMDKFSAGERRIQIEWVKAHQKEPKDKNSDEWFRWNGNRRVDEMASEQCRVEDNGKRRR